MTVDKIMEIVTAAIASVGGIGGIIAIACTIVRTLGGNSVKAKLAAAKIDTDKTMDGGLAKIGELIESRIKTDITVDISSKVDKAVERQLEEQKSINKQLMDNDILLRQAAAEELRIMADFKAISLARRDEILAVANALQNDVNPLNIEPKAQVSITLDKEPTVTVQCVEVPVIKRKVVV